MRKVDTVRGAWQFLAKLDYFWRFHQIGRSLLVPFQKLVDQLPERGSLLDLGCGHGLFLALAKMEKPEIELIGLDLSQDKISAARRVFDASNVPVRQLAVMDIADFPRQSVDVISIIDVLYLVPMEQWDGILKKCFHCLKPGGKLLLKEMDRSIAWKFALLMLEETLAVKVLGLTLGGNFTFPRPDAIRLSLANAGFEVEDISLHRGYLVPHHLWIGRSRHEVHAPADC